MEHRRGDFALATTDNGGVDHRNYLKGELKSRKKSGNAAGVQVSVDAILSSPSGQHRNAKEAGLQGPVKQRRRGIGRISDEVGEGR